MKKLACILLVMCLALSLVLTACDDPQPPGPPELEKHVIAFAVGQWNVEAMAAKAYYENYLASRFNVEFICSDALGNDVANAMAFVENAYTAGAEAVINIATTTATTGQVIADKCDELGMWHVGWTKDDTAYVGIEHAVGTLTPDFTMQRAQYKQAFANILADGKPHNFVIHTCNSQYGSVLHINGTVGMLEAIKETYGLTFADTPENLVRATSTTEIETGRDDVRIVLMNTYAQDDLLSIIKNGEFDVIGYPDALLAMFSATIASVEAATGTDIKIVSMANIDDTTASFFNTPDTFGNPFVNAVIIKNPSFYSALFVLVMNSLYGHSEAVKDGDNVRAYLVPSFLIESPEEYEAVRLLGSSDTLQAIDEEDIKQMLIMFNPDANGQSIQEYLSSRTLDVILEARGLG